jgi:hypothetical protein
MVQPARGFLVDPNGVQSDPETPSLPRVHGGGPSGEETSLVERRERIPPQAGRVRLEFDHRPDSFLGERG